MVKVDCAEKRSVSYENQHKGVVNKQKAPVVIPFKSKNMRLFAAHFGE